MAYQTIPLLIQENGKNRSTSPAYYVKRAGTWIPTSWAEYAGEVWSAAKGLVALGVEPGQPVNIIGFNRPEWVIMDVAAMTIGAVPAGIYTTNSADECAYILNHSEAPVLLVEDAAQWEKISTERDGLTHLRHVVTMKGTPDLGDPMVKTWDDFIAGGADVSDDEVQSRLDALEPDQLATLIYTSGTTGPPKGVMLSHDNLYWTAGGALDAFDLNASDVSVSYLPLSHIAEQMFTIHSPARTGGAVYYAESIDALADNLQEIRPTVFFGVPRVWEKFHSGIRAKLDEATGVKAKLAQWATGVGRQVADLRNQGKEPTGALAAQYKIADKLVFHKVLAAIGLDRAKALVSGAAPISQEILEFFSGLGIIVSEVYGQSEGSGPTTLNVPGRTKFGSVGPEFPGVEVKVAADDEVLVKGPNVFLGYYKDDSATAETLQDGWLMSGDLGRFDNEGFLHITGRKKDIIITAGGKNVAPKPMESTLKNHRLISEVVVIGDRRKYLTALVTLDEEACAAYLAESHLTGDAHEQPLILDEIQLAIDEMNAGLARVEQIKKFKILPRQLTIEDGELTPTLKVKRNVVTEHFAAEIESMYEDEG